MKSRSISAILVLTAIGATQAAWPGEARREVGALVIEGIPEIPERIVDRMRQYQSIRSASLHGWDAAGRGIVIDTQFGETTQLHRVKVPGGARSQLTFFSEPIRFAAISPDPVDGRYLYLRDVGGGESYQIFQFDPESARSVLVTDGSSRNGAPAWSNKGDRFVYYSTRRNGRDWDLFLAGTDDPRKPSPILEEGGFWVPVDWSPDDARLLVLQIISANETHYSILDVKTRELTPVHPSGETIAYGEARWSPDGKGIFVTSDEGTEFKHLRYYDLSRKQFTNLTGEIPWDVNGMAISPARDRLAFTTNENGFSRLYLLDTATRRWKPVQGVPEGVIDDLHFDPKGARLGFVVRSARTPGDVYALTLSDGGITRWTYSEVGGLDPDSFASPELITYETFDQVDGRPRRIPAFYYRPRGTEGPHPVLISIHGGPESQYRPEFRSTTQYFVNQLGLAVLAPNVRGSSGYGKSYLLLDNGERREDTVRDIGALLDWIAKQPELDASRVGVIGGSYGGYMSLATMTHYGDRVRAGIDIVGISNFVTFLENTSDYRRDLRRVEYGDERDPKMREHLLKISPARSASRIDRPMFIAQGENDPRVPVSESEQMVDAIRQNGNPVWYLLARDEGHGFRKRSNRDYYTNAVVLFLETYLIGEETGGGVGR